MSVIFWIIGLIVAVYVIFWVFAIRGAILLNRWLIETVEPAIAAVESGDANASGIVLQFAADPMTRNTLYAALKKVGKAGVFPVEYRTPAMIGESDLVRWLMHPNELGVAPRYIALVCQAEVQKRNRRGQCFLFRFLVEPPHWAACRGWMAGVAGPFWDDDPESSGARDTFSELLSYNAMTETEHIEFLQAAIKKKGLIMPTWDGTSE